MQFFYAKLFYARNTSRYMRRRRLRKKMFFYFCQKAGFLQKNKKYHTIWGGQIYEKK